MTLGAARAGFVTKLFGDGRGVAESLQEDVDGGAFGAVGRVLSPAQGDPAGVPDDLDAATPLRPVPPFFIWLRRRRWVCDEDSAHRAIALA
ncbi:MAG: hypothetical protein LC775_15450 [Acidobacteria bacterium]|nr:hypothetical protein [Acidobacteriota bacterium]